MALTLSSGTMMGEQAFYFSGGSYLRQLQGLHQTLSEQPSVQLLVGREGTGKSALCEKLAQFLRRKHQRVLHLASGVESPELLRLALARQLELPAQANPAALIEEASHASDQPIILIVDDVHLLTETTLLEINRLAQVQIHGQRACSVVLSAEPALLSRIQGKPEFSELQSAADRPFELQPMSVAELEVFLQAYGVAAGHSGLGFTEDAMQLLYKLCKGYPGPANKLAAEVTGNLSDAPRSAPLTRQDLDQFMQNSAGEQLLPSFQLSAQSGRPGMLPVAAVVVIASLAFVYQQLAQQPGALPPADALPAGAESSPFTETPPAEPQVAVPDPASRAEADGIPPATSSNSGQSPQSSLPVSAAVQTQTQIQTRIETEAGVQAEASAATIELDADRAQLLAAMEQARRAAQAAAQAATDSDLVLVTAVERGISADQFALPSYEDLLRSPAIGPEAMVREPVQEALPGEIEEAQEEQTQEEQTELPSADSEPVLVNPVASDAPTTEVSADRVGTGSVADTVASAALVQSDGAPAEGANGEASVRSAVDDWVQAWQSQDLDAYFTRYHSRFQPRYQDSVAEWRRNRQRVIGNAAWIELTLTDYQVVEADADSVEVQFWLGYESGSYQDHTLKKLVLLREEDAWRIIEEVNLEVRA